MKTASVLTTTLAIVGTTSAFQPSSLTPTTPTTPTTSTSLYGYVPSGFTEESYKKFKEQELKKKQQKNLGRMGPKGFKSRSFQSFQEALERGEATHLMPVMNAKEKVKKGILKPEDIPYMQRGGAWDNSDVRGAKKSKWLQSDKDYAAGGFKKEQSVSIFGVGEGLDWTGKRDKVGPYQQKQQQQQAKKVAQKKGVAGAATPNKPKKNFFGLF